MLVDSFPEELKQLKIARDNDDWVSVREIAHKLKGGTCYCGTVRLKEACTQLDAYIKSGQNELRGDLYNQMLAEITAVENEVKNKYT